MTGRLGKVDSIRKKGSTVQKDRNGGERWDIKKDFSTSGFNP